MKNEEKLIDFACRTRFEDIPEAVLSTVKDQFLTIAGTTVAGAAEDGCEEAVRFYRELGGKEEATILIYRGKIPAHDAAFVNAAMARALDLCDSIAPGPHIGAALIMGSLAAAELAGGMNGRDFFTAITIGNEVAARMNLSEEAYNGFDPTGICVVFGVASAVSRILGLSRQETWNALALAFNRCGGSFQSHIDGSLGVRFVQGWVAQAGILCTRLASKGITGPRNFLEGIYGYLHLYGKDLFTGDQITDGLGEQYRLQDMVYKKYPSCALTQGPTETILRVMAEERLSADDIDRILITVPPYTHKLVGHEFEVGDNPRVNAQFSIRYCVANAMIMGDSRLEHFEPDLIRDGKAAELSKRITVIPDKALEKRGHTPMDMRVLHRDGREFFRQLDIGPGFPGNALTPDDHKKRFQDCLDFAKKPIGKENAAQIASMIEDLDKVDDVRRFVQLLLT
ncbi:MAG: 2-methylcitrate dehydratase [Syntrophorhabdus sp. PtaU1.Bin058]|nr:MAG: 2-methylcitrate dehydratase [Syntrophorhabdus sp. PtaU1.Bin058]